MNQPRELMLLSKAERALVEAKTVDEVKDYRDKAAAVKAYAKKAKLGQKLVVEAASVKLRAERRLGEILQSIDLANATPGNQYTGALTPPEGKAPPIRLRDLGITKSDSARSQRVATLPAELFERYLTENTNTQTEPTMAGLLRLYRTGSSNTPRRPMSVSQSAIGSTLNELLEQHSYSTVYADPPWPSQEDDDLKWRKAVDAIAAEPIAQLAAENAHLHLWATTTSLPHCFRIIRAWGFTYRSCLVCLDTAIRGTLYWRDAQQFLLFANRGDLPFVGDAQPGWLECDWPQDGHKPDAICDLIEQVSPGPYLNVYGNAIRANSAWHSGGLTIDVNSTPSGKDHVSEKASS
jgi:N6-adenosine-specific RNA methylase IME4